MWLFCFEIVGSQREVWEIPQSPPWAFLRGPTRWPRSETGSELNPGSSPQSPRVGGLPPPKPPAFAEGLGGGTPDSPVGCTTLRACVWFFGLGTPKRRKLQGGGKPRLRGLSRPKRHSLNGEPRRPNKLSDPHRIYIYITNYKDVYIYMDIHIYMYIYIYICLPTPLEMGSSQSRPPHRMT